MARSKNIMTPPMRKKPPVLLRISLQTTLRRSGCRAQTYRQSRRQPQSLSNRSVCIIPDGLKSAEETLRGQRELVAWCFAKLQTRTLGIREPHRRHLGGALRVSRDLRNLSVKASKLNMQHVAVVVVVWGLRVILVSRTWSFRSRTAWH